MAESILLEKNRGRLRIRVTGAQALALSTILTNLVRIVSTMCLTRLLTPDAFGIVGIITSTFYVVNMVTDIGLQSYVVRHHRADDRDFLNSVYTIHTIRGACLTGVGILLAWPLSRALDKPELLLPLGAASLIFAIEGHTSLHQFRGLQEGKVQRFAIIDLSTSIIQTISAIALAFLLRNVWAIVLSMFIASTVRASAGYFLFPGGRHSFRRDREVAADLWRFSRAIAMSSVLTLILLQIDKMIFGRILSLNQFGIYVIGASLASAPGAFAYNYANTMVYAGMANAWRENHSIADAYYRYRGRFFYLYLFGAGGIIGGANLIVRLLYDPRYIDAASYLSVLAVSTAFLILTRSMETVDVANGRTRTAVEYNLARLLWVVGGGALALARQSSWIFLLTIGLMEVPAYAYATWRLAKLDVLRPSREVLALFTVLTGALTGWATAYAFQLVLPRL